MNNLLVLLKWWMICTLLFTVASCRSKEVPPLTTPAKSAKNEIGAESPDADQPIITVDSNAPAASQNQKESSLITLTYVDRFDIGYKSEGLSEPSGLSLSAQKDSLWTVSDGDNKIFGLYLDGARQNQQTLSAPQKGLEGITLGPTGEYLFVVQEEENEIFKLAVATNGVVDRRRLSEMGGYEAIANLFAEGSSNKGLEGITWDTRRNRIFVLKEGEPGMLIALSPDLTTIGEFRYLTIQNGFRDDDTSEEKLDFSGVFYDAQRDLFWIVSDKGQRLFLYDWSMDQVIQSLVLNYDHDGKVREIEKAEGVVLDEGANRLYIVSDSEARLYLFDVHAE